LLLPESGNKISAVAWPRLIVAVDDDNRRVTQASKPEPRIMRYELTDYEWKAVKPFLPNKPRGFCA
jgi:hypothetical protein